MPRVIVTAYACTPVGELWEHSIQSLGARAVRAALNDVDPRTIDFLLVGNMLSAGICRQENLAAAIAERAGIAGIQALKVEAACAGGGAALKVGHSLVASGECSRVVVLGVEKMTDAAGSESTDALALACDHEHEAMHGMTFAGIASLLTSMYCEEAGCDPEKLGLASVVAHRRASGNPNAMFRNRITQNDWQMSPTVATSLRVLDCAPICDGAAAVVLEPENVFDLRIRGAAELVAVEGATDCLSLSQRTDPIDLPAARESFRRACGKARVNTESIDVFELHDAFPVTLALSFEALGLASRCEGWKIFEQWESDGGNEASLGFYSQTMGGLKARGHPIGATGIYQLIDVLMQMDGTAGQNQIPRPRLGACQIFGGAAANVFTSIVRRIND